MTTFPEHRTRYGVQHPEWVDNALWDLAVSNNWTGFQLREYARPSPIAGATKRHDFSLSSYRDTVPGPFWSWVRFGRTTTALPDGRVIHIAGEHEDFYDADFCIYNDVVVEYPGGRREFYLYPQHVFPPTDFHTATLIGSHIWLIGSLGYRDLRRHGETQVLKLDIRSLQIEPIVTAGDGPGWISRHATEAIDEATLLVVGGSIDSSEGYGSNDTLFELDLRALTWRRRPHGDTRLFPVADEDYRALKSPRYGRKNPERVDNPFWLAMASRRWKPSRARLHFGSGVRDRDSGRDARDASSRDAVWTAVRDETVTMRLADGRALQIGGRIPTYGAEGADAWIYNDIVVTCPNGEILIFTYPSDVFSHFAVAIGVMQESSVYVFGIVDRGYHPDRSRGPAVLRLDTTTFSIEPISAADPPVRVNIYAGCETRVGERIVFPIVRQTSADSVLGIAFDLGTRTWGDPMP